MLTKLSLKTMLQELIARPSISSVSPEFDHSNIDVVHILAEWLTNLGFNCEVIAIPDMPNKANLIASLGQGPGGLVLAGHTDTVPYDEQKWSHDPFKLFETQNAFFGLGTSDMKSFFALVIQAIQEMELRRLQHPLILLATADEESSMAGAKHLVEIGRPEARFAVIGEPTGMKPVHMHKGIMMEAIHINGHAGHSSDPSLGANAIDGLHEVLGLLKNWRGDLESQYSNAQFSVPVPTLNLGLVAGGDNPNRICAHSQVHFDLRLLPGMDMQQLRSQLDEKLLKLPLPKLNIQRHSLIDGTPPMHTPEDSPLVRAAEKLTGYASEGVAFCTEGPYLNALGMDTLILGPGDIEQAHQPDEFIRLDRLNPTVALLKNLIKQFCLTK